VTFSSIVLQYYRLCICTPPHCTSLMGLPSFLPAKCNNFSLRKCSAHCALSLSARRAPSSVLMAARAFRSLPVLVRSPRAVLVRSPRAARTTRSPPVLVPCPTAGSPVGLACYRYSHLHWLLSSSLGTNTTSTYIVK
jgi:hypothetical protein